MPPAPPLDWRFSPRSVGRALAGLALCTTVTLGVWFTRDSAIADDHGPAEIRSDIPPLRLGLDAFRRWDQWYLLEIGTRMVGRSTADPAGSNADGVSVLQVMAAGERVLLDQVGPGVVLMMRFQESTGSPWNLTVDGGPTVKFAPGDLGQKTPSTFPAKAWPYPLSLHPDQSQGSSIIMAPIAFRERVRLTSSASNGNFYAITKRLPHGARLTSWSPVEVDPALAMTIGAPAPAIRSRSSVGGALTVGPRRAVQLASLTGPAAVRRLTFSSPRVHATKLGKLHLRIYWDDESVPSVNVPIKYLAGVGAGVYQPTDRQLVNAFPAHANGMANERFQFTTLFPMPFSRSARIELKSDEYEDTSDVRWEAVVEPLTDPTHWYGKFHANDISFGEPGTIDDMTFLDVRGTGKIVGTVINFSEVDDTLEGDPRFYLDDSDTPQIAVTGTEEWGLGGNYWRFGKQTTLPFGGHPSSGSNPSSAEFDGASLYRFLLSDALIFNRRAVVRWEHGPQNNSRRSYRASIMWYGIPAPTSQQTDDVIIGDAGQRTAHDYRAEAATAYDVESGYGYTVSAATTRQLGIRTAGPVSFVVALNPANVGAYLRRTFDFATPNQRAEVWVDGQFAGIWYSPGSSSGKDQFGISRRWRDEEFLLPEELTAGKQRIRLEIRPVPSPNTNAIGWTEFRYRVYSFVRSSFHGINKVWIPAASGARGR